MMLRKKAAFNQFFISKRFDKNLPYKSVSEKIPDRKIEIDQFDLRFFANMDDRFAEAISDDRCSKNVILLSRRTVNPIQISGGRS